MKAQLIDAIRKLLADRMAWWRGLSDADRWALWRVLSYAELETLPESVLKAIKESLKNNPHP